ncbi:MAG: hypothetical protein OEO83_11940 [Alphaproteobacteria bacterium]|nr:hypothetical protein [Alphaproteobacteria bacterium]
MTKPLSFCVMGIAAFGLCAAPQAAADEVADFYKNTRMTMVVGAAPGGGYDLYSRLIVRHMVKHIPGAPGMIAQNMPGAASIRAANYAYAVAKQDGSVIVALNRTAAFAQIFGQKGPKFDAVKFQWLGSLNNEAGILRVRVDSGVKTIADARRKAVILGATAPGADTSNYPALLNNTLGTKFRLVFGYPSGPAIDLAIERGEVQGQTDSISSMLARWPKWREQFNLPAQLSLTRHPDLHDVPLILDFVKAGNLAPGVDAKEAETFWRIMLVQQVMGRPFALGPRVPAARVKALRTAFQKMVADNDFLADAKRQKRAVSPTGGDEVQKMITEVASAPKATIAKLSDALKFRGKMEKAKISYIKDTGPVVATAKGGRVITIQKDGKKLKARVSGRSTKVTIGGKKAKRSAIKTGMTCTLVYPAPGQQAKEVNCKM